MLLNLIGSIGSIIKYRLSSQCQLPFHFLRVTIDREITYWRPWIVKITYWRLLKSLDFKLAEISLLILYVA